jgi:hypothetical protein
MSRGTAGGESIGWEKGSEVDGDLRRIPLEVHSLQ